MVEYGRGLYGWPVRIALATLVLSVVSAQAWSFDASQIPHVSEAERASILEDYSRAKSKSTYTLAVSEGGRWDASSSEQATQGDRVRIALQKCEHHDQAHCGITVLDGENVGFRLYPNQLRYERKFDLSAVPFVRDAARNQIGQKYAQKKENRALALSRSGRYGYVTERPSADDAAVSALGFCNDGGKHACFLYDLNGRVLFSRSTDIDSHQEEKNW
jgi:hypothetical protein